MVPVQETPGYYWRTNDAADLAFNDAGPQPPTHISCYDLHYTLNRGEIAQVPIAELHFLARAHFGDRNVGWTGDAYRFGIYRFTRQFGRPEIVVIVSHGGGMEAYSLSDLVAHQTWSHIAEHLSEDLRWNLCYEIMHAQRAVKDEATRIVKQLFLEGRLKKRRRRNRSYVQVLAAAGV
jgi:hypothetical protein